MNPYPESVLSLSRKPSAFVPMAMSLIALVVVLLHVLRFGVVHEADEGPTAHTWQLLMAGQLPMLAYFVIRWIPRVPRQTLGVFALQIVAALAALAPVYLLGL
jgi:ABC-type Co2+ transport system permease subunit